LNAVPNPGEVVYARGSYWAVNEVRAQALPRSSADENGGIQHEVTLTSLAEGKFDLQLRVVWELEIGASVRKIEGLPKVEVGKFDDPQLFGAFVDALRWGAVTSADAKTLQAPFRSGAKVEAYQLEPVRRALTTSRANLLLADDVGLGKTIEAGLVVQELLLRHRARTVCVVAPAGLALKWQDEMQEKFGLDFFIINSETIREIRRTHGLHVNPFNFHPRIIISMQWLPMEKPQRYLGEIYEKVDKDLSHLARVFDVLIVDEAHHVAPSSPKGTSNSRRGYATDTLRTRAVRELASRCEHRLFLTATPHNGYKESFTSLLEMIDNRRFARGANIDPQALSEVVVRRLKSTLTEAGIRSFPARIVKELHFKPSDEEANAYQKLEEFLIGRAKKAGQGKASDLPSLLLKKRFLSSPVSFGMTVSEYARNRGLIQDDYGDYEEVLGEFADDLEEGRFEQTEFQALQSKSAEQGELTTDELRTLEELSRWGMSYAGRPDSRLKALLDEITPILKTEKGDFTQERIVIFSEFVHTLNWIKEVLESRGLGGERLAVIVGDTDSDEREIIREKFQSDPSDYKLRILLATDAAGEGIDLQNYCHRLYNYDIPFNPNRLEQRAGRIDRYGQLKQPQIHHFSVDLSNDQGFIGDFELLARIAKRIGQAAQDLGELNAVIGEAIQNQLSNKASVAIDRPKHKKLTSDNAINEILLGERNVRNELTKLEEQLDGSMQKLHVRPANLERVVSAALTLDHQPKLELAPKRADRSFVVPSLDPHWHLAISGLATRLEPNKKRFINFSSESAADSKECVYVHLGHPLVQRSANILRSALWRTDTSVNRVAAVKIEDLKDPMVAAITRLVLVGKGGVRLHEEVFLSGVRISGKQLGIEASAELLEQHMDASNMEVLSPEVQDHLVELWNDSDAEQSLQNRVKSAISSRVAKKLEGVQELLSERERLDKERVIQIFERFSNILQVSLAEAKNTIEQAQDYLFDDEEIKQLEEDIANWKKRLSSLDVERDAELASISARYSEISPHQFTAALIFATDGSVIK
jgi:superfamily II DNA or RNA helicase